MRTEATAFVQWTHRLGCLQAQAARWLNLAARTVRHWLSTLTHRPASFVPLGRPTLRSPCAQRQEVLDLLDDLGPGIGVPTLRECFPAMPRAELAHLVRRYRRWWQRCHPASRAVLHWTQPGTVWAMDFTETPMPIDGRYPYLLAVRDLASGQQLLALPVPNLTAAVVEPALATLFDEHAAPLVLKMDNGSAFRAELTRDFLRAAGVIALYSPPRMPRYNGAIEAGIGSLKTRTERSAAHHGRSGHWTWDDVEAARLEANATARPHGPNQPSPDAAWHARRRATESERVHFQHAVERNRLPATDPLWSQPEHARADRHAVRCTLEACGYLLLSRRPITLPIPSPKTARDS